LRILIACSEAVPYAKTGGLADVTGALLREFRSAKQDASLILPLYSVVRQQFRLVRTGHSVRVPLGNFEVEGVIWAAGSGKRPDAYFIECDAFFGRPELYGTGEGDYTDNALRFIFFSRAVLEACRALDIEPDVIHCNDWQTGMIPVYLKTIYGKDRHFKKTVSLLTVHNLGYQGVFEAGTMSYTGLGAEFFVPEKLEFFGRLNFLKAGLLYADVLNTVSPTYAKEILTPEQGFGLDGILRARKDDLSGIINGIDPAEWDPSDDPLLPSGYSRGKLGGKRECKVSFCREARIRDRNAPLLGMVSRLSSQKGVDLLLRAFDELIAMGANIALLGKGDEAYHEVLQRKAAKHRGRVQVTIGFEESLAHRLYAAADFFLMPSQYEPCGIGQLIAMRYGTIPVARKTGGLADTIEDYDHLRGTGSGILFQDFTPSALRDGIKRGLCISRDPKSMGRIIRSSMEKKFFWRDSSRDYLVLYRMASKKALP
jgi:starch synthase